MSYVKAVNIDGTPGLSVRASIHNNRGSVTAARTLERQLKRKKNPKLAIVMLRDLRPPSSPA